jgi:hypothetical protein
MANPATVDHIVERWRPLSAQEETNAEAFLEDAWAMLLDRRPTLEADLTATTVRERNVVRVVCTMVLRVLKNMDGWAEESVDDWRGKRHDLVASGELFVSPSELADVTPGRATRRSIRLVTHGDS